MISIIICSANANDLKLVRENISATIGIPYEVIAFDNSAGSKGICEIYNQGTKQAKFDILCFMHEDISFRTVNWGKKVLSIFDGNEETGLLGIAGGGYKSLTPSSWYNYHLQENGGFYANLIQGFKHTGKPDQHEYRNPKTESLSRVACIDGCWMCTRKTVAKRYPFDDKRLKKFHGYDLDFSIAVNQKYQVMVTFEVLLQHFSEGNFNSTWMDEIVKVHKKWGGFLPINVDGPAENKLKQIERNAMERFMRESLDAGRYTKSQLAAMIWNMRSSRIASISFPFKLLQKLYKM